MNTSTFELRKEYEQEKDKLNSLCEKWQHILNDGKKKIYNEDVKGAILSVLGQSRLLLDKKLKQFDQLLRDGEKQIQGVSTEGGQFDGRPITLVDLEGFWEVVMIQVKDVYTKFSNLETMDIHRKSTPNRLRRKT